jgi:hypothetical protein
MSTELKQVFTTPDGSVFENKADALDHLRAPKIQAALMKITGNNVDLSKWLTENSDVVKAAFEVGTIRRVTKSERNKLQKALEAVAEAGIPAAKFLVDNTADLIEGFRWPSVKRMDDAEKVAAARESILEAGDNNVDLADWAIANKDAILEAYEAGKEKREVSDKAKNALADYRAKKAAEKAAADKAAAK